MQHNPQADRRIPILTPRLVTSRVVPSCNLNADNGGSNGDFESTFVNRGCHEKPLHGEQLSVVGPPRNRSSCLTIRSSGPLRIGTV